MNPVNDWNNWLDDLSLKPTNLAQMPKHGFPDLPARFFMLQAQTCV